MRWLINAVDDKTGQLLYTVSQNANRWDVFDNTNPQAAGPTRLSGSPFQSLDSAIRTIEGHSTMNERVNNPGLFRTNVDPQGRPNAGNFASSDPKQNMSWRQLTKVMNEALPKLGIQVVDFYMKVTGAQESMPSDEVRRLVSDNSYLDVQLNLWGNFFAGNVRIRDINMRTFVTGLRKALETNDLFTYERYLESVFPGFTSNAENNLTIFLQQRGTTFNDAAVQVLDDLSSVAL